MNEIHENKLRDYGDKLNELHQKYDLNGGIRSATNMITNPIIYDNIYKQFKIHGKTEEFHEYVQTAMLYKSTEEALEKLNIELEKEKRIKELKKVKSNLMIELDRTNQSLKQLRA